MFETAVSNLLKLYGTPAGDKADDQCFASTLHYATRYENYTELKADGQSLRFTFQPLTNERKYTSKNFELLEVTTPVLIEHLTKVIRPELLGELKRLFERFCSLPGVDCCERRHALLFRFANGKPYPVGLVIEVATPGSPNLYVSFNDNRTYRYRTNNLARYWAKSTPNERFECRKTLKALVEHGDPERPGVSDKVWKRLFSGVAVQEIDELAALLYAESFKLMSGKA